MIVINVGDAMSAVTHEVMIAGRKIGVGQKPFIIAEMSGNHDQSLEKALKIVEEVAKSGADALKLQTYTPDTITLDLSHGDFFVSNLHKDWDGDSLYNLYKKAYTPWEWHQEIFKRARELGLIVFSTPFDETAVDFLESLDVPCYKIASFENVHIPLIKKIAATGKPIIMSTGMASVAELHDAVAAARQNGCKDLILLKCTSSYPASPVESNLLTIPHLRNLFDCNIGLSDHTLGIGVAVASVALGGVVIEKHVTLSRADGGVDATFSLEPDELKSLVIETERAWQSLGTISYAPTAKERESVRFRRSLYIAKDIRAGEVLTKENLRSVRPGGGLAPKYFEDLLGKKVTCDIKKGTPVSWSLVSK